MIGRAAAETASGGPAPRNPRSISAKMMGRTMIRGGAPVKG